MEDLEVAAMAAIASAMEHLEKVELDEGARQRVLTWMVSRWGPFPGAPSPASSASAGSSRPEVAYHAGQEVEVELERLGRKPRQAQGRLEDGTLVVVDDGEELMGQRVRVYVTQVRPTVRGVMLFGRVLAPAEVERSASAYGE